MPIITSHESHEELKSNKNAWYLKKEKFDWLNMKKISNEGKKPRIMEVVISMIVSSFSFMTIRLMKNLKI
jgi:hypothetical protein